MGVFKPTAREKSDSARHIHKVPPDFPYGIAFRTTFSASGPPLALMSLWVLLKKIRGRLRDIEGSIILPEPVESGATQGNKNFEAKGQTIAEESVYPQVIGRTVR